MAESRVFSSIEVRWFFDGAVVEHRHLRHWFETTGPVAVRGTVSPPVWHARLDGEPDMYLLLPGAEDMGIKWREGLLQVKGLVAVDGLRAFGDLHSGTVERWIKWSYAGMPEAYRQLFVEASPNVERIAVRKVRALRLLEVASGTAPMTEVRPGTRIDKGIAVELTDLEVGGEAYCSLGFEAFPDDAAMRRIFADVVATFLAGLEVPALVAERSLSYPALLNRLVCEQVSIAKTDSPG